MKSDDEQLAEVAREIEIKGAAARVAHGFLPAKVKVRDISEHAPLTDGERKLRDVEQETRERRNRAHSFIRGLVEARGKRYAACSLGNFQKPLDEQVGAIQKLTGYCDEIPRHAFDGRGVFLYGPCGTGKDHLAMAVAKCFINATSQKVEWTSGAMLFEELRDSFDGRKSEGEVLRRYVQAPMLWMSDPLPVRGELTPYQSEALYRLVDARYNAKRPVLVTANMAPGEADKMLGAAIARRLRDSTIQVHCNWAQYRG